MAETTARGMGTPISPAFSMTDSPSLAVNPITAASRMKSDPITASSRAAASTTASVTPFRTSPFQPARDSSVPSSVFFER